MAHQGEPCYNLPYIYTFDASIDEKRLAEAVVSALKLHPYLLGHISLNDAGEPVITVDDEDVPHVDVRTVEEIEQEQWKLLQPFDLLADSLVRAQVLRSPEAVYLFLDMHHIVCDGTTMRLLLDDIENYYTGQPVEAEARSAAEVARDEAERRAGEEYQTQKQWYASHYDCAEVDTRLIPDVITAQPAREASVMRKMQVGVDEVATFATEQNTYKSNFFTCALGLLLARYNNENEAVFTTIYHGRTDKRLRRTAGMFVKTFPIYLKLDKDATVQQALAQSEELMSGCRSNDLYSFAEV